MKKILLIFVLFFSFNLNIYAKGEMDGCWSWFKHYCYAQAGSNYGASLKNIYNGLQNKVITISKGSELCFYKTYVGNQEKDDDYVVLLFEKYPNGIVVGDVTGKFATVNYTRANSQNYSFQIEVRGSEKGKFQSTTASYGGTGIFINSASASVTQYVYKGNNIQASCRNLEVTFPSSEGTNITDSNNGETWHAKYTSMSSTEKYIYDKDGTDYVTEQMVKKAAEGIVAKTEDEIKYCYVTGNTKSSSVNDGGVPFKLDRESDGTWFMNGTTSKACFGKTDGPNSISIDPQSDDNFKKSFNCDDYCVSPPINNTYASCTGGFFLRKDSGSCDEVSEEIKTSSHEAGALITKYKPYKKAIEFIGVYKKSDGIVLEKKSGTEISARNISNYKNIFLNKEGNKYPEFLVKSKNKTKYEFVDKLVDQNGNQVDYEEVYTSVGAFTDVKLDESKARLRCEDLFGVKSDQNSLINILNSYVVKTIQIGVPILLILLTSFDFVKAIFTDDEEGLNNAKKNVKVRIIASIGIFITPILLVTVIGLIGGSDSLSDCIKYLMEIEKEEQAETTNSNKNN